MTTSHPPAPAGLGSVVRRFDHISLAVYDITTVLPLMELLGATYLTGGNDANKGYRWVQFDLPDGIKVELLEPRDPEASDHFLVRFLQGRGEGVHHLTFRVDDVPAAVAAAERAGYQAVGVDVSVDWREAFLHPRSSHGVLIQLAQWERKDPYVPLEQVLGRNPMPPSP